MADKNKQNEHLDLFSRKIRQKMEDHTLPVDMNCWEAIEIKIKPRPRKLFWSIGGIGMAAAAVIALLLLIRPNQSMPPVDVDHLSTELVSKEAEQAAEQESLPEAMPVKKLHAVSSKHKMILTAPDTITLDEAVWDIEDVEIPDAVAIAVPPVKHTHSPQPSPDPSYRPVLNRIAEKKTGHEEGNWLLAANMATGGHLSLNFLSLKNDQGNMDPPVWDNPSPGGIPGIKPLPPAIDGDSEGFRDINCAPPLSVGFSIRKNLNKRIGIETGLVYTCLVSRMKDVYPVNRNARLQLHYLGVPVNLVVTLWDRQRWNIYLSGGAMMEKGLRSIYDLDVYSLNGSTSSTTRSGIQGLQWSLNLSAGVSYHFHSDWSLYLEPRYSYYFDNHQPVSSRTKNKTLFGVGAGIRFEF